MTVVAQIAITPTEHTRTMDLTETVEYLRGCFTLVHYLKVFLEENTPSLFPLVVESTITYYR